MSRKNDNSLGWLFTLLFFPVGILFFVIRDLFRLLFAYVFRRQDTDKTINKPKRKHSESEMDDLEFDEMNDIWDE